MVQHKANPQEIQQKILPRTVISFDVLNKSVGVPEICNPTFVKSGSLEDQVLADERQVKA